METPKILLVGSDTMTATEIENSLKSLGYDVAAVVESDKEAKKLAEKESPSIILMDLRLINNIDLKKEAEAIRNCFDMPVTYYVPAVDEEKIKKEKRAMPSGYFITPVQERELKNVVEMTMVVAEANAECRKAEKALSDSRIRGEKYEELANLLPQVVFETDQTAQLTFANQFAFDVFQYTQAEFDEGLNAIQMIAPEDHEKATLNIAKVLDGASVDGIEYIMIKKDGTKFHVLLYAASIIHDQIIVGMRGILFDITYRKKAQEALLASEKRFRQIFENAQTPYYEATIDGTLLEISPSVEKYLKYKREELIGMSLLDIYAEPKERERFVKKFLTFGEINDEEVDVRDKDGGVINCIISAKYIEDEQKTVGSLMDITERKKSERALKDSQHRLATHREQIPMGIIEFNKKFEISSWNPAAEQIFGYSREEAMGRNTFDILVPDYERDNVKKIHQLSEPKSTENINDNITKDGKTITCHWYNTPIINTKGELAGMTAVCQDITEKLNTEQEVKHLQNRLDNIINSMPSVLIGVNTDVDITYWNNKATEISGFSVDEAVGRAFIDVLPHYKKLLKRIQKSIRFRSPEKISKHAREAEEVIKYENITVYPLTADEMEGAVILIDDVTDQVQMERMMIQTEKMMSVGGLAAGMAHELNNPLGGMLQGVQNIQRRLSPDLKSNKAPAKEFGIDLHNLQLYLEKRGILSFMYGIIDSGKKAAEIISNMLQFSRKSESQMVPTNFEELIENVLELAGKDYDLKRKLDFRNINITREFDPNLPPIPINETEIEQVILNLFRNATQAMGDKKQKDTPRISIRMRMDGPKFKIEVEDNGPGMDEDVKKRIFEPFYTTKPIGEGTGLGLSVSYMIITNNHQGTMEVDSEIGKGTKFIIRLPMSRD